MPDNYPQEIQQLQKKIADLQRENDYLYKQVMFIEKEALQSSLICQQLSKASIEGIVLYTSNSITLLNEAMYHLFGYNRIDLLGKDIYSLIAPYYREATTEKFSKVHEEISLETICIRQDKSIFPARIHRKSIKVNNATSQVLIIRDITDDKAVKQELQQSEKLYYRLFEESRDAIYISGVRGDLQEVNQASLELFGYDREEMIGMNALRLYYDAEDRRKFTETIQRDGSVSNYEVNLVTKEGEVINCVLSSSTRRNANMEIIGYHGIIRDITEQKRTSELIKAKELAEKSASMKERFLANMSHEIRTPMNAVIGMTNLLQDTGITHAQKKYVDGIKGASEHLLVIINDILDFSKIEAGRLEIETIEFDVLDVLKSVIQTFKFKAAEKSLDLRLIAEDGLPTAVVGDPTRLLQILMNLVSNAIKFTKKGSITIHARLFNEDSNKATLAFSVTDTGMGIPEDKIDTVFSSFEQVSRSTTRLFGGTGLGLTITKKLIEMQGGSISVKSKVGEGTSFIFVLKFPKGSKLLNRQNKRKDVVIRPLGKITILLVEDNELNQVVAVDTLKKWGKSVRVDIANHGAEALDLIKKNSYDIVLMDVQMPVMNGYDATKAIRNELGLHKLPILAMTAYATTGEAEKTIIAGMDDYISKPFDPKKLFQKIVQLSKHQFPDDNTTSVAKAPISTEKNGVDTKVTDLQYLTETTGDDPELMAKMIEIMLRETPEEIKKMEELYSEKKWDRLRAVAHKFKSAVTYMGLNEMKEVVKDIQTNAQNHQNLKRIGDLIQQLKLVCTQALGELEQALKHLQHHNNTPQEPVQEDESITDLTFLTETTGDDPVLMAKMIEIMLRETPEEIQKMEILYEEQDWDRLRSVAHKFKSSVTYMGLHDLKDTVKAIQTNAEKRENLQETQQLIKALKTSCSKACNELEEVLQRLQQGQI